MALLDHGGNPGAASAIQRTTAPERQDFPALALTGSSDTLRSGNDNQPPQRGRETASELDCLRGMLAPDVLQAAARRSLQLGLSADRVLIQWGAIDEDSYVRRLASHLGVPVNRLVDAGHDACSWSADQLAQAAASGIVPLRLNGELVFVIAPRCLGARGLARSAVSNPALIARVQLTTTHDLNRFLARQAHGAFGEVAANGLRNTSPEFSAAPMLKDRSWLQQTKRTLRISSVAVLMVSPLLFAEKNWTSLLAASFLGFIVLRLVASAVPQPVQPRRPRRCDAELPIYTIIAALYREASSVAPLMRAINALNYPHEKLDIILVTEADDANTRQAIARLGPMPHLQVLIAPVLGPKTKPKALNFALPFARGSFVAVFDAEDRPEPDQLRASLDAFAAHDNRLACAQASLCIDNAPESFLSRMFAAEYAGQFDAFLPGLAALNLPLPLGGSSNHFRADILRKVGAWDAYNVTEDADLGVRLARFGYRSTTFSSTTFEEAPVRFGAWLRQRSRWMKGWMQTWGVHMRNPKKLWRDAGPRGFLTINLIVGGNVLTALAYPTLIVELLALLWSGSVTGNWSGFLADARTPLHLTTIAAGYLSAIAIGLLGLARRRQLRHGWILLLAPIYWGLLSIAAWRALWQLLRDPYYWEKTDHGLSRRSRAVRRAQR